MLAAGTVALVAGLVLPAWDVRRIIAGHGPAGGGLIAAAAVLLVVGVFVLRGLIQVAPGEAVLVQLFGRYLGSLREPGLRWVAPWTARRRISLRIRSYEMTAAKVNDAEGAPVEIGVIPRSGPSPTPPARSSRSRT
jgi:hypothetical protein